MLYVIQATVNCFFIEESTDIHPSFEITPARRRLRDIYHQLLSLHTAFKGLQPRLVGQEATLRHVQTIVSMLGLQQYSHPMSLFFGLAGMILDL